MLTAYNNSVKKGTESYMNLAKKINFAIQKPSNNP